MKTIYIKTLSSGVMFTVTFMGGFLPYILLRKLLGRNSSTDNKLSFLRCLAGGIFLGTCLIHLLPEARAAMETAFKNNDYPVSEACIGIGFLILYVLENVLVACRTPKPSSETTVYISQNEDASTKDLHSNGHTDYHRYGSVEDPARSEKRRQVEAQISALSSEEDVNVSDREPLLDVGVEKPTINRVNTVEEARNTSDHNENNFNSFRSFVLLIALSLHTVFDGLVIGIQTNSTLVWTLLVAMSIHKCLVAFSLGLSFLDSHPDRPRSVLGYLLFFSLVAPIGTGIGTAITESSFNSRTRAYLAGFLQSVATGTFMFVTFCECLKEELTGKLHLVKLLLVIVGFGLVAGLRFAISDE